jgi:hypothetical protein
LKALFAWRDRESDRSSEAQASRPNRGPSSVVACAAAGPVERLILRIHRHHSRHAVLRLPASAGPGANQKGALRRRASFTLGSGCGFARLPHVAEILSPQPVSAECSGSVRAALCESR